MTEELITMVADRLGASRVPVAHIMRAWRQATERTCGCLNEYSGQCMFIHNRLIEYDCFDVGMNLDTIRLTCELHIMDPSDDWDDQSISELYALFCNGDTIASTSISSLMDATPVNQTAAVAHLFPNPRE